MSRASVIPMAQGSLVGTMLQRLLHPSRCISVHATNEFQSNIEDQLFKAIKIAEATSKGTKEASHAWEVVEELDQTLSHLRGKNIKSRDRKDVAQEVN